MDQEQSKSVLVFYCNGKLVILIIVIEVTVPFQGQDIMYFCNISVRKIASQTGVFLLHGNAMRRIKIFVFTNDKE